MKLVAGLGNPGRKYAQTRHNVGYEVVAELARRYAREKPKTQFQGETLEITVQGERLMLLTPTTFMNLSGGSVLAARDFYKIAPADVLIVCDDFNLPLGRLRLRPRGSAGGQKGLADVIRRLGTEEVSRLRLGIGAPPQGWIVADYVLSRFTSQEVAEMQIAVAEAADAVERWATQGLAAAMNRYNAGEKPADEKDDQPQPKSADKSKPKSASAESEKTSPKRNPDQPAGDP